MYMSDSTRHGGRRATVATALCAVATFAGAAAPARASAAQPRPLGDFALFSRAVSGSEPLYMATLACDPDGGTLPGAHAACDQLRAADGRIDRVPATATPCPLVYAPVRVIAVGLWHAHLRSYDQTFFNRCAAIRATGGVIFAF